MNKPVIVLSCAAWLAAAALIAVKPSYAQTPAPNVAAADILFKEAMKLVAAGNHEEACVKLDASFRLDPAIVPLFRLAECYENTGKLDAALSHYLTVVRMATDRAEHARAEYARKRAEAIQARRPKPETVPAQTPPQSPQEMKEEEPKAKQPLPEKPLQSTAQPDKPSPAQTVQAPARMRARDPVLTPRRIAALAVGGVGLVGIVVGSVSGARAFSTWKTMDSVCDGNGYDRCDLPTARPIWESASSAATLSTAGFVVSGIGLATAAVLWFLPTNTIENSSRQTGIRVAPLVDAQVQGVVLQGEF